METRYGNFRVEEGLGVVLPEDEADPASEKSFC
jgi:hypothetical protein